MFLLQIDQVHLDLSAPFRFQLLLPTVSQSEAIHNSSVPRNPKERAQMRDGGKARETHDIGADHHVGQHPWAGRILTLFAPV